MTGTWEGEASGRRLADLLIRGEGDVVELRAIGVAGVPAKGIVSGYFDNADQLLKAAAELDGKAKGVYVTLNPVRRELIARANNRIVRGPEKTTSDNEIAGRRLLLIDLDAVRPAGISASEVERQQVFKLASEIAAWLKDLGWPEPAKGDSGNGAHLLYCLDLEVDDGGLVQRALTALAFRFDTEAVHVDQSVHNPARITKFYGTMACKGDHTPDRPHRRSRLFHVPELFEPVPLALLEGLASRAPVERAADVKQDGQRERLDLVAYLEQHGVKVQRSGPWQGGQRHVLEVCPFDPAHADGAAFALQFSNGAVAVGCLHSSCAGKGWHDFRDAVEPGWRSRGGPSVSSGSGVGGPLDASWPEPQPLADELPPVDDFDYCFLPAALHPWIKDIAERIQCPPDFPGVAVMIGLAGVVGRRLGIRPKQHDDWLVVPNLWGCVIGRPGVLKTPAIQEPLKPLKRLEIEAKEEFEAAYKRYEAELILFEARKKGSSKAILTAIAKGDDALAIAEDLVEERPEEPVRRRYLVNDSTVEKLGEILHENPQGATVYRDELTGFLWSLDKEGQEGARAFYLEAWNGTGRYTYDRIGRGTIDIESATVSLVGAIQPGPLGAYLHHAVAATQQDDGLMQRFQLAVWPDCPKRWVNVDRWPNSEARKTAYGVFERLAKLDPASVGAKRDDDDLNGIPFVHFSVNAQGQFDAWRADLERRVRSGQEHPAIESHLAKYRSLVPSLALLIHLADDGQGPVGEEALTKAIAWAKYLESHARRLFSLAVSPDLPAAKALAGKIRSGALRDQFALRDVYRPCWTGLAGREDAERAVRMLTDLDWLREVKEKTGGAPKTYYLVNPRVREMPSQAPDKTAKSSQPEASGSSVSGGAEPSGAALDRDGGVESFEERAAIHEYDAGLPREDAERLARAAADSPRGQAELPAAAQAEEVARG